MSQILHKPAQAPQLTSLSVYRQHSAQAGHRHIAYHPCSPARWRAAAWFGRGSDRTAGQPAESWELEDDEWDRLDDSDEQELANAIFEVMSIHSLKPLKPKSRKSGFAL